MENLTISERIYGISLLWKEAEYNFAHWDKVENLNWDEIYKQYLELVIDTEDYIDYYKLLKSMYALLKDGHTFVKLNCEDYIFAPKIALDNIGEDIFIKNNFGDTSIPVGSKLIEINSLSTKKYLRKYIFPYIASSTNHYLWTVGAKELLFDYNNNPVTIKILTPNNITSIINLDRFKLNKDDLYIIEDKSLYSIEFEKIRNKIEYIKINTFMDKSIVESFRQRIESIDWCNGLIIDIRKNRGGNSDIAMEIVRILSEKPFRESKWKSPKHIAALKSWNNQSDNWEEGDFDVINPIDCKKHKVPIVILIGNLTFSAAEDFLIGLDSANVGIFIGEKTAGSSGNSVYVNLPGGIYGQVCSMVDLYPDNREFVGYGINPHINISKTIDDILKIKDLALCKAIEYIESNEVTMSNK
ncbi:MAG: S41 family peptidase [Paraclostridium sp.]|uniref:S41 family peptidase n=1 Tax=Paraclostridium sp. TaxID=2023273 RepID=UPI003F2DEA45